VKTHKTKWEDNHVSEDGDRDLESELRGIRPDWTPFLDELAGKFGARRASRGGPRALLSIGLTVGLITAIATTGGVGYAFSLGSESVAKITQPTRAAVAVKTVAVTPSGQQVTRTTFVVRSAAATQYTTPPTTSPPPATPPGDDSVSTSIAKGAAGTVEISVPASAGMAPTKVAVNWTSSTFATPVVLKIDPTPSGVSTFVVKSGNVLISITVTDSSGAPVKALAAPLDITFVNPSPGFVPAVSEDGVSFRAVPLLQGTTLPDGQPDGYYVDSSGTVHLLTRHLTIFGIINKANVNVSESGRKTPPAGSGLFGDPTRNHVGATVIRGVGGSAIAKRTADGGTVVRFTLFIDEQASLRLAVLDATGNQAVLSRAASTVRGARQSGGPVKNMQVVIKRPGTITFAIKIPRGQLVPAKSWKTYRLRVSALDFDGNRTVRFLSFKA